MTTRYSARSQPRFNVPGLPSGYEGRSTADIVVPSVGIEDVDKALFDLFNDQIPLVVGGEGQESKKVPIVFYTGEKWALAKKFKALRDRNGSLILPLITAVRTNVMQDPTNDITGRGTNQQTGEIVIHRRLDKSDRGYQGLINRLMLEHQLNLAVAPGRGDAGQLTTLRELGDLAEDPTVGQGGLMIPDRKNNVYETIVVPAPQFFTAQYDFVIWTQYNSHMQQILSAIIASQLPQGNCWRLDTAKGYWFMANVVDNLYAAELNADDYSQEERSIRYKFSIKVPGYMLASSTPGAPVPIKRYVSSPSISFQTDIPTTVASSGAGIDPFLGADDPTLPLDAEGRSRRRDQRRDGSTRLFPGSDSNPDDPALDQLPRAVEPPKFKKVTGIDKNGKLVTRLFRVKSVNTFTGETVVDPGPGSEGLTIVVVED